MHIPKSPVEHYIAHLRCPRCSSADFKAHDGANHVPLHLRLHFEDGWNRGRRHRAPSHLLVLLRTTVLGSSPHALCQDAGGQDRASQGGRMALKHRLGWCRRHHRGQALPVSFYTNASLDPSPADPFSDSSTPVPSSTQSIRESWPKPSTRHTRRSTSTCPSPAPVSPTNYSTRRSHGPERPISRKKSRNSAVSSPRTSRSTPTRLRPRSSKLVSTFKHVFTLAPLTLAL